MVPAEAVESWRFFLRGLWESGLRLSEALSLSWDDESRSRVDLSIPQREKLIILGQYEKGRKNRVWPIPPGFVLLLNEVPVERRTGPVFAFAGPRGGLTDDKAVSRMGAKVFETASVLATNGEHSKRATLHDLRRTFALRMKRIVRSPLDLQRLMRHEDINTTKDYYVGDDDEHLHVVLWTEHASQSGHDGMAG